LPTESWDEEESSGNETVFAREGVSHLQAGQCQPWEMHRSNRERACAVTEECPTGKENLPASFLTELKAWALVI